MPIQPKPLPASASAIPLAIDKRLPAPAARHIPQPRSQPPEFPSRSNIHSGSQYRNRTFLPIHKMPSPISHSVAARILLTSPHQRPLISQSPETIDGSSWRLRSPQPVDRQ